MKTLNQINLRYKIVSTSEKGETNHEKKIS